MSLAPGVRFGAYEILAAIGAGGMGEVYRARDTRLNRDVAIKILPDIFAADTDRVARFEREAQVLASLNHSNIAHVHGLEELSATGAGQIGRKALVLELVEGPTLADLVTKGPIPIDDALPIARQITEALEAAHEHGIIHRDLKPANIKLTSDGLVKVLDFGLAKAVETTEAGRTFGSANLSMSPTVTSPAMTMGGQILGTAAYMSPEQAKGKRVDKRADIWAFGCVLFEMLSGKRAFGGDDVSDTLVAILRDEPQWSALPVGLPGSFQGLLRRCLEKDATVRLRDIGEARVILSAPAARHDTPAKKHSIGWRAMAAALAGGIVIGIAAMWVLSSQAVEPSAPMQRFSIALPATTRLTTAYQTVPLALSRNGTQLLYLAEGQGPRMLHLRNFEETEGVALRGTENAARPFFSPDGQHAAFNQVGRLMKTDLRGGTPADLGVIANGGGTWTDRDEIVYVAVPSGGVGRLFVIPAAGGTPRMLPARPNDPVYTQPHAVAGTNSILFTISNGPQRGQIAAMALDRGEITIVDESGEFPHYVSSGHVVFLRAGKMMVRPFDADRLVATGPAVPAVENVRENLFSVAHQGLLVYVASGDGDPMSSALTWVDRTGRSTRTPLERAAYAYPRLSDDGTRAAVGIGFGAGTGELSMVDLLRGSRVPLTHGDRVKGGNLSAISVWGPGDNNVTFSSSISAEEFRLEQISADGTGRREVLYSAKGKLLQPGGWSRDGRQMVFYSGSSYGSGSDRDLHSFDMVRKTSEPLLVTKFREVAPQLSPDAKWVAFVSDMTGRQEVYVMRFPDRSDLRPASNSGGTEPVWAKDGRDLFYRNGNQMMSVSFKDGPKPVLGSPQKLFESEHRRDPSVSNAVPNYDVGADGRFLMVEGPTHAQAVDLSVVVNWGDDLKRLAPGP